MLSLALTDRGYTVNGFNEPIKAIEFIREHYDNHLLITDYMMPDIDGLALIKAVKGLRPNLRLYL
jgi:DNA-binding NtrC family response regulator